MIIGKHTLLRYFPAPRFLKRPEIGFEVNEEAIRFIEIVQTGSGLRVGRFGETKLSAVESDGSFLEGKRLLSTAEEFCGKNKLDFIRASLPDDKAYVFKAEIPRSFDKHEIRSAVELRLEEFVPVPPKEAVFDFQIINPEENKGDVMNVSVSVLPRAVVSKYLDFFKSLGLLATSLETVAQATADAVIKRGDNSAVIVVNFGASKTSFHIVRSGIVHFSSSIAVGGDLMTQTIMKSMSIGLAEAESIKQEKGVVKDDVESELFFSLLNFLSSIKDEVTKLVEYWRTHKDRYTEGKEDIEKVVVCGSEAGLRGLVEYLEGSSGVPTELADVWVNVTSLGKYVPPIGRIDSLAYATVIGLALAQYNID